MSGRWPLGSEVKRKDLTGGAMLYDASRVGNVAPAWFDTAFWRDRGDIEGEAFGRGTTHFVRNQGKHYVLRHYRRGGLVARVMRDHYLWRGEQQTRAFQEWQLLYHLHRAGLPVPAPIATRYRRQGMFYTADLITERLMDSVSLASLLRKRGIPILGWITIGRCLRTFHDLGVCHPDLNAHNILLVGDDAVYLLDFDRGRLMKPGLWCDGNLVRLRRSLEKITYKLPPENFSEADWHGLLDGYRQSSGHPGASSPVAGVASPPVAANATPSVETSTASPAANTAESGKQPIISTPRTEPISVTPAPAASVAAPERAKQPSAPAPLAATAAPERPKIPPAAAAPWPAPSVSPERVTQAPTAPQRTEPANAPSAPAAGATPDINKPAALTTPRPELTKASPAPPQRGPGTQGSLALDDPSSDAVDDVPPAKSLSAQ